MIQQYVNDVSAKFNETNTLLFKILDFFDNKVLRSIYFAIFESKLNYCSLVWAQKSNAINRLVILQKKAFRIMNFQAQNSHISPLFKKPSGLKFKDKINLENIIRISKSINNLLPPLLSSSSFKYSLDTLNCETSWSSHVNLHKTSYRTNIYGNNSVTVSAVKSWNKG